MAQDRFSILISSHPLDLWKTYQSVRILNSTEGKLALFVGERIGEARPLNVNSAIDLGAEIASEFFLLSVAIGLLGTHSPKVQHHKQTNDSFSFTSGREHEIERQRCRQSRRTEPKVHHITGY